MNETKLVIPKSKFNVGDPVSVRCDEAGMAPYFDAIVCEVRFGKDRRHYYAVTEGGRDATTDYTDEWLSARIAPQSDTAAPIPLTDVAWFSYDPGSGFEFHETEAEAQAQAEKAFEYYKDEAADESSGWADEVEQVCFGQVSQRVRQLWHKVRPPKDQLDECNHDKDGLNWANWDEMIDCALHRCVLDIKTLDSATPTCEVPASGILPSSVEPGVPSSQTSSPFIPVS